MDQLASKRTYDAKLVERLKVHDEEAVNELLEHYGPPLIRYLMSIGIHNYHDAEDLAAEAIYKAMDKLDSYHSGKGGFNTWLFEIAKNRALDFLNKPSNRWHSENVQSLDAMYQIPGNNDRSGDQLSGADQAEKRIIRKVDDEDTWMGSDETNALSTLTLPADDRSLPRKARNR